MLDFQNHLGKTLYEMLDQALLDEEGIRVVNRPLYHSRYKFTLGMSLAATWWVTFSEVKQQMLSVLEGIEDYGHFHSNSTTLSYYLYSNNPNALKALMPFSDKVSFGFLHIVDKASWERRLPAPKPKSKFYHFYNFRIRFNQNMGLDFDHDLKKLRGPHAWSHTYRDMFYVRDIKDMMLLKLLYSDSIIDIEDRSDCPE